MTIISFSKNKKKTPAQMSHERPTKSISEMLGKSCFTLRDRKANKSEVVKQAL